MIDKGKIFNRFISLLDITYCQYYIWKALQKKEYEKIYRENNYFWVQTLNALLISYSVGLAKLVEKQSKKDDDKVISIFYLLELEFNNLDEVIKKIHKLRNKILMHNDLKTAINGDKFFQELDLNYGDVENLLDELIKISDKISHDFDTSVAPPSLNFQNRYKLMNESCEKDITNFVNKLSELTKQ